MTLIPDDYKPPPGGLIRDQDKPQDLDDLERQRDHAVHAIHRDEDERDNIPENDEED